MGRLDINDTLRVEGPDAARGRHDHAWRRARRSAATVPMEAGSAFEYCPTRDSRWRLPVCLSLSAVRSTVH